MTSQLNDTEPSVDHKMLAETVLVSGDGLRSMLDDLLDFAEIEAGRHELESIAFDLRSLVQDVADSLSASAHQRGLELSCRFPDDLPVTFRGDPGRLRRVVTSLVGSALNFTPSGEVLVELIVEDHQEDNVMVRFEVVGVGFGITRTHQPALFESFSPADPDTVRSFGAAGLGLAMAQQLVELMGGQIGVQNDLGRASTFWFSVPLDRARSLSNDEGSPGTSVSNDTATLAPAAAAPESGDGAPAVPAPSQGTSGQILLAEDNPVNQRVASAMLENLGFGVDVVADGAQAVKAAAETSYNAILMDGQMPILDGYLATTEIRLHEGSRHTPIIAVTGSAMKCDQERCLAAGMDDYLAKPLNLNALAEVLQRWASEGSDPAIANDPSAPAPAVHVGLDHLDDPDRPVLDAEVVARLRRLGESAGEDLMGQLASLFLSDADTRVGALRQAIARDDAAAVVRSAHTLSGASANLGATALARLCATLAADGAVGDLLGGDALLDALEDELDRVRAALASAAPAPC
jgi:CheY-like chemotaxis protein/HPt (histidine-containing phosphotransfer) domain-containing protein